MTVVYIVIDWTVFIHSSHTVLWLFDGDLTLNDDQSTDPPLGPSVHLYVFTCLYLIRCLSVYEVTEQ